MLVIVVFFFLLNTPRSHHYKNHYFLIVPEKERLPYELQQPLNLYERFPLLLEHRSNP